MNEYLNRIFAAQINRNKSNTAKYKKKDIKGRIVTTFALAGLFPVISFAIVTEIVVNRIIEKLFKNTALCQFNSKIKKKISDRHIFQIKFQGVRI